MTQLQTCRWFVPSRDCYVVLTTEALGAMRELALKAVPNETGGTLLGTYAVNGREARITRILGVRQGGRRSRTSFFRPPDSVDGQLAERQEDPDGAQLRYIGEWHSHPHGSAQPSATDLQTLSKIARNGEAETSTPVLIIIGGNLVHSFELSCVLAEPDGQCRYGEFRQSLRLLQKQHRDT